MDGEKKDVVVRSEGEKRSAHERASREVERAEGFLIGKRASLLETLIGRRIAQINHFQLERDAMMNNLFGFACCAIYFKRRAKRFVTPDNLVETTLKPLFIQTALKPQHDRDGVSDGVAAFQFIEEPQSLLRERKRETLGLLSLLSQQLRKSFAFLLRHFVGDLIRHLTVPSCPHRKPLSARLP